jgi:hypothetical protein
MTSAKHKAVAAVMAAVMAHLACFMTRSFQR